VRCLQSFQDSPDFPLSIQGRVSTKSFDRNKDDKPLSPFGSDRDETLIPSSASQSPEQGANAERWITLCARAAVEQDPKKLLELVIEINRLLDTRRRGLAIDSNGTSQNK
jgi:hypothetical protein